MHSGGSVLEHVTERKVEAQRGGVPAGATQRWNPGTSAVAHHLAEQLAPLGPCQDRTAVTIPMNHPGSFSWAADNLYTALPGTRTQHFLRVHPLPLLKAPGLRKGLLHPRGSGLGREMYTGWFCH